MASGAQVFLTGGHDSESSSHVQLCTVVESTSLIKGTCKSTHDTITNFVTTLELVQIDASSTHGHASESSTLAGSDDASEGLPISRVLQIDCPAVSSHTRSKVKQNQSDQDLGDDDDDD